MAGVSKRLTRKVKVVHVEAENESGEAQDGYLTRKPQYVVVPRWWREVYRWEGAQVGTTKFRPTEPELKYHLFPKVAKYKHKVRSVFGSAAT